jgi:hypothetical protein
MTLALTDAAQIARSRVHPCVVWEQFPSYGIDQGALLFDSDRTPDEGYR